MRFLSFSTVVLSVLWLCGSLFLFLCQPPFRLFFFSLLTSGFAPAAAAVKEERFALHSHSHLSRSCLFLFFFFISRSSSASLNCLTGPQVPHIDISKKKKTLTNEERQVPHLSFSTPSLYFFLLFPLPDSIESKKKNKPTRFHCPHRQHHYNCSSNYRHYRT